MSIFPPDWEAHISHVAADFDRRLGLRDASRPFVAGAAPSQQAHHVRILMDDFSEIPFLDDILGVEHYQLRSFLRAGQGDACIATCPPVEGYQAYNEHFLGLGRPEFIAVPPGRHLPIAISAAAHDGESFERLVAFCRQAGSVNLDPYMSLPAAWSLAAKLEAVSGVRVRTLGPPPPITAFANNKEHLSAFADALAGPLLGRSAAVPTEVSSTIPDIAHDLSALAARHDLVAIKMPRCASAMGNSLFEAADLATLRGGDIAAKEALVAAVLKEKAWDGVEPVLSVAWLATDSSPSTQCWIPAAGEGPPRLDGVYEQLLVGDAKVFLGSVPARLPAQHVAWMRQVSMLVAAGYQRLGYAGRCSFDFIIHEDVPYLVECNGRWGGTSIPMLLVERVLGTPRPYYRSCDLVMDSLAGCSFLDLQRILGAELYDRRTGRGTFIVYNVGCLAPFGKFDVIALGDTPSEAQVAFEERLPALLAAG